MFPESYFSIGFTELIGFAITIVSVWLIGRQLTDSRLASQMEGMLALGDQDIELSELRKLIESDIWKGFDGKHAYEYIYGNENTMEAYYAVLRFFERLGILVRRKALNKGIAFDLYGGVVPEWWGLLEKVTMFRREENSNMDLVSTGNGSLRNSKNLADKQ